MSSLWYIIYLTVTMCLLLVLFKWAEEVKHYSTSVNPDNQPLYELTLMLYKKAMLVLYFPLKACKNNINSNILALVIILPLNMLIILIKLSLFLTLQKVLLMVLCTETVPNPVEFLI